MKTLKLSEVKGGSFPPGLLRLDYESALDGRPDWALVLPGQKKHLWVIVIHGHGSAGDQLYTRRDVRETWLPVFIKSGAGILTVNLRGNSWMGPAAAFDMRGLVSYLRAEQGMRQSIFCSGSMGGTSNLIYGVLHPEDVSGIIARGAASDPATYLQWCRSQEKPILHQIASAIESSYGGTPEDVPETYRKHSALQNSAKLSMPVYLSHGGADLIIPVEQSRDLAERMKGSGKFVYHEIPGGNHDSPLYETSSFDCLLGQLGV